MTISSLDGRGDLFDMSARPDEARLLAELEQVELLLPAILHLKPKHLAGLPGSVQELSRMLTSERGELARGYLQSPAHFAAYVSYFLPWNLHRLTRLIPDLGLDLPDGARILDIGSGPLTFPLALWLARPDLRSKRLNFVCSDRSKKILSTGAAILDQVMSKSAEKSPWRIELLYTHMEKAFERQSGLHLVSLCNVLNEAGGKRGSDSVRKVHNLVRLAGSRLAASGQLLAVEPGTRVGGGLISLLRHEALASGLAVLSPCTHQNACPLQGRGQTRWCHFVFKNKGVSVGLRRLSKLAGLEKNGLSLSFALLAREGSDHSAPGAVARIVSQTFKRRANPPAAYGCSPDGLLLMESESAGAFWPGRGVPYVVGESKDGKSGALLAREKNDRR